MVFFFKKKEIVLNCFTYSSIAYDHAKIDYGKNYFPEWWKNEPMHNEADYPTIKYCVAFKDFYNKGIIIPSWFEIKFFINENNEYGWTSSNHDVGLDLSHPQSQFYGFSKENGFNVKLTSPWIFKTKEEIFFTWTSPTWSLRNNINDFKILPGVISFKYQTGTNINLFVEKNENRSKEFHIEALTPLVILHPISERKLVIKNHLISKTEWDRKFNNGADQLFLQNNFQERVSLRKKVRDHIDKKCPFHE
jgi:hypothetical protein